jgi:hypothetical protein
MIKTVRLFLKGDYIIENFHYVLVRSEKIMNSGAN